MRKYYHVPTRMAVIGNLGGNLGKTLVNRKIMANLKNALYK